MRSMLLAIAVLSFQAADAAAQQQVSAAAASVQSKSTGDYLAEGYEVKGVINNTYLILQKGNRAYFCGSRDPGLTWANWAEETRNAGCVSLTR